MDAADAEPVTEAAPDDANAEAELESVPELLAAEPVADAELEDESVLEAELADESVADALLAESVEEAVFELESVAEAELDPESVLEAEAESVDAAPPDESVDVAVSEPDDDESALDDDPDEPWPPGGCCAWPALFAAIWSVHVFSTLTLSLSIGVSLIVHTSVTGPEVLHDKPR
jgi:hypothetical protein